MSEITIVKDNGSLVGSDGDHLYDGERVQIGFDELVVTTEVAEDGLSFTRTTALPNGEVRSASTVTFEGFATGAEPRIRAGLGESPTEAEMSDALEAAWEAEKTITSHSPVVIDALVDGVLTQVEKKISAINWTQR